jgi:hypothetical protein
MTRGLGAFQSEAPPGPIHIEIARFKKGMDMSSTTLRCAIVAVVFAMFAAGVFAQHLSPNLVIPSVSNISSARSAPLFKDVRAASLHIVLEKTSLFDVQHTFGGTLQHEGDAGDATEWLCYSGADIHGAPTLFWFSSGEMGGAQESILGVAQQPNPDGKVPDGCANAPHDLTHIDVGVPGVGATLSDVTSHFGAAKPDANGHFHYAASYPADPSKDFTVTQTIVYTTKHGVITGVAITQVSAD